MPTINNVSWPIVATAPGESPYAHVDLTSYAREIRALRPYDRDIIVEGFYGDQSRTLRSMQKGVEIMFSELPFDVANVFHQWKQERRLVRPFPNYNEWTIFYQSFQRPHPITGLVGSQIGPAPAFDEAFLSAKKGAACYLGKDNRLYPVAESVPRYERIQGVDGDGSYWPVNGLLVEDQHYQYFPRSHPQSGYPLWSTKTGSPSIVLDDGFASPVDGQSYTTRINMATGEKAKQTIALSGDTGPHSFEFWVYASGAFSIDVRDLTTQTVKATSYATTIRGWSQIRVENVTKGSGDSYEIVITSIVAGVIYCGPQTCQNQKTVARYVHNNDGTDPVELDHANCTWAAPFAIPWGNFSLHVLFAMPRRVTTDDANQWIVHQENTSPDRFGLRYKATTNMFSFQRGTTIYNEYVTTQTEDAPVMLTALAHHGECHLFENAILGHGSQPKDSWTGSAIEIGKQGFNLGDPEINSSSIKKPIAFLRIDKMYEYCEQAWEHAGDIHGRYFDPRRRFWQFFAEGRDFVIDELDLRIMPGYPTKFEGSVSFQEVRSFPEATIEVQY